ncbi:MAG: trigger factor [Lachnospira sp.]|nr:trigger factor [Lachnospira sp.]
MKKRFFSAIFATVLLTSFIGCSNNKAASDGDDTSNKAMKASEYNSSFKANAAVYKNLVTLPNYEGLEVSVDKSILDVTEEKVDEHINKILSSFSTTEQVKEGVTESGDSINLDFCGKLDGVAFAGGTATSTNYTIGSGGYIQDLDQGLIGLTVGQEYDIPCTFPENYQNSEMAGKDVIFTVTVNYISKTNIPVLTDEWISSNKEAAGIKSNNITELKQETKDYLTESNQLEYDNKKYTELMKKIVEGMTVTNYPEKELNSLIEVYKNNVKSEYETYKDYYASNGITDFNGYLANMGLSSEEEFEDYAKETSQEYLKNKMAVTIIAADNNIEVTETEIKELGEEWAQYYGYDNYQGILDEYGDEMNCEVGFEVLYQKVQKLLIEKAVEV